MNDDNLPALRYSMDDMGYGRASRLIAVNETP
jgi:hypothetical protein